MYGFWDDLKSGWGWEKKIDYNRVPSDGLQACYTNYTSRWNYGWYEAI